MLFDGHQTLQCRLSAYSEPVRAVSRDLVHRQTSCAAIKHMALGVYGFGCEDALVHLLNNVWPNIFETSPHLVQAFMDAVEGMRVSLGPQKMLQYCMQVREMEVEVLGWVDRPIHRGGAGTWRGASGEWDVGWAIPGCMLETSR